MSEINWRRTETLGGFNLRMEGPIGDWVIDPAGAVVIARERSGRARAFDAATGRKIWARTRLASGFAAHPDGQRLFVADGGSVSTYEMRSGDVLEDRVCVARAGSRICLSRDGQRMLVAGQGVFELPSGRCLQALPAGWAREYIALASSGAFAIGVPVSGGISRLDIGGGERQLLASVSQLTSGLLAFALSPDDTKLYMRGTQALIALDLASGAIARSTDRWADDVKRPSLAISPDGQLLALCDWRSSAILLVDARSLEVKREMLINECDQVAFSPDGTGLWVTRFGDLGTRTVGGSLELRALGDGRTLLPRDGGHLSSVTAVVTARPAQRSSAHDLVLSSSDDGTLRSWDLRTRQPASPPLTWGLPIARLDVDRGASAVAMCSASSYNAPHRGIVGRIPTGRRLRIKIAQFMEVGQAGAEADVFELRLSPDGQRWVQIRSSELGLHYQVLVGIVGAVGAEYEIEGALAAPASSDLDPRPRAAWWPNGELLIATDNTHVVMMNISKRTVLERREISSLGVLRGVAIGATGTPWVLGERGIAALDPATLEAVPRTGPEWMGEDLSVSRSGAWLAILSARALRVYDAHDLRCVGEIDASRSGLELTCAAFSTDDRYLLAGTRRGPVLVFERPERP